MRWWGDTLVILFVLLAPVGGPCDRRSRPADPLTSRLAAICGQAGDSQPSFHAPDICAGLLEMYSDILEEEDGEGFEVRIIAGRPSPFTPPSPGGLDSMDCDRHHGDSGRSARSPLLRC